MLLRFCGDEQHFALNGSIPLLYALQSSQGWVENITTSKIRKQLMENARRVDEFK